MIVEECREFGGLPFDCSAPARPFRPYSDFLRSAWSFVEAHASIVGLFLSIATIATGVFL